MEQPGKVGLYDPAYEKDACGVGFIADLNRTPTHKTVSGTPTPSMSQHPKPFRAPFLSSPQKLPPSRQ